MFTYIIKALKHSPHLYRAPGQCASSQGVEQIEADLIQVITNGLEKGMDSGVAGGPKQIPPPQTTHYSSEAQVQALSALEWVQYSLQ